MGHVAYSFESLAPAEILNLILWGSRKKMLLSIVLTDLLACEHTALLMMDDDLQA